MTKAGLITALEGAGWTVETGSEVEIPGDYGDLTLNKIYVHKEASDVLEGKWIHFWMDGSDAYWQGTDPTAASPTFAQDVETYMATLIGDTTGDFVAWFFETINAEEEYAIVVGYVISGTNINEGRYVVDYDATPELQHREIT